MSNIITSNKKEKPQEIAEIIVTYKMKYLGITINDNINYFKTHKVQTMEKAITLVNMTFSIIARRCAGLIIGKTWEKCCSANNTNGSNVIDFIKQEIEKLQTIENSVKQTLGASRYTQEAALIG